MRLLLLPGTEQQLSWKTHDGKEDYKRTKFILFKPLEVKGKTIKTCLNGFKKSRDLNGDERKCCYEMSHQSSVCIPTKQAANKQLRHDQTVARSRPNDLTAGSVSITLQREEEVERRTASIE